MNLDERKNSFTCWCHAKWENCSVPKIEIPLRRHVSLFNYYIHEQRNHLKLNFYLILLTDRKIIVSLAGTAWTWGRQDPNLLVFLTILSQARSHGSKQETPTVQPSQVSREPNLLAKRFSSFPCLKYFRLEVLSAIKATTRNLSLGIPLDQSRHRSSECMHLFWKRVNGGLF